MAKMRVHELAKELNTTSRDIIEFLQGRGVDVKAPASCVEGDAIDWAKKRFAPPAAPKAEEKQGHTERMTQVEKSEASNTKSEASNAKAAAKPHKKSKTIIVVNNPQNSRMRNNGGGNNGGTSQPSGGNGGGGGTSKPSTGGGGNNKPSGGGSTSTPGNASLGQQIANRACQYVGNPYKYGGTSLTNGADCSGFVMSVHALFGISTPRDSWGQLAGGKAVNYSDMLPGDVIVYSNHVAIYIGGNQIVHASNSAPYPAGGIKISSPPNYRTVLGVRRYW